MVVLHLGWHARADPKTPLPDAATTVQKLAIACQQHVCACCRDGG